MTPPRLLAWDAAAFASFSVALSVVSFLLGGFHPFVRRAGGS